MTRHAALGTIIYGASMACCASDHSRRGTSGNHSRTIAASLGRGFELLSDQCELPRAAPVPPPTAAIRRDRCGRRMDALDD